MEALIGQRNLIRSRASSVQVPTDFISSPASHIGHPGWGSERLILLGISGIEADKGLSLHLLDNEVVRFPGVIGLVGQVDRPFLDLVP